MRILQAISVLLFSSSFLTVALAQTLERSVTVYAWPVESAEPQQLAQINYNPATLSSAISRLNVPKGPHRPDDLVRVGFREPGNSEWRGILTSAASFDEKYQQKIALHVDNEGAVWHVGFSAHPKLSIMPSKVNGQVVQPQAIAQIVVEIIKPSQGPQPVLNRPVVLNAEGKIQEKEPEKTFIQRYWWIIGLVLLVQIMAAGGSDKK